MLQARASWLFVVAAVIAAWPVDLPAQNRNAPMARWWEPINDLPNPWVGQVLPLPDGRSWGSTAGVDVDPTNGTVWIIDRCGSNTCVGSDLDPILQYDADGTFLKSFGSGMFAFPHGIHADLEENVWVTDPLPADGRGAGGDVGQQVTKFSPNGQVLMELGTRKVTGRGTNTFSSPSDVVVGRNGDIFVADGHAEGTNERIVKFDRNGTYTMEWGVPGFGPCGTNQFSSLHALEIDSQGRLFVGDRDNNRIQIFDQDGNFLECWFQFGTTERDPHRRQRHYIRGGLRIEHRTSQLWRSSEPVHSRDPGGKCEGWVRDVFHSGPQPPRRQQRSRGGCRHRRRHHLWRRSGSPPGSALRATIG